MKLEHSTGHQACPAGYAVRVTSAKFCLHAANVKFSTQYEECRNKCTCNYVCNFTCVFVCTSCAVIHTDSNRKCYKGSSQLRLGIPCFFFRISREWISNVTYVSINKQSISFNNCFGALFGLCGERIKISDVAAGSKTLCRGCMVFQLRISRSLCWKQSSNIVLLRVLNMPPTVRQGMMDAFWGGISESILGDSSVLHVIG